MTQAKRLVYVDKKERRDTFVAISLALYVFSSYLIITPITAAFGSAALYAFVGITFFKIVTGQTPLKFISYSLWYLAFIGLGSLSLLYALNNSYVINDLYRLSVSLILTFSYIQYIRNYASIVRIFSFYAYSPIFLAIYLFQSGAINTPGERLGEGLFSNANVLAHNMMIALFCITWFIAYGKSRYFLIKIFFAMVFLYVTALTGGRKSFLIPFIFFLLILTFKYWRENKPRYLFYIMVFALLIFLSAWALTNVPSLYNSIGVRFEGMSNLLNGDPANTDASTRMRLLLIQNGWRWFLQRPLLGHGLNNYKGRFAEILGTFEADNNYIELLVDLGLVGTILYYSFYTYTIAKLIRIRDDATGLRNFFLAFMLVLGLFDLGEVTYKLYSIQIFIGMAAAYAWLYKENHKAVVHE